MVRVVAVILSLVLWASLASAHGGRTNSQGCHNERKTGGYHCHNGGGSYKSYRSNKSNSSQAYKSNNNFKRKAPKSLGAMDYEDYHKLVRNTQKELKRLGYAIGKVDGVLGMNTTSAIQLYQKRNEMKITGMPSYSLLNKLHYDY